ncbi:HAAS signaling domain-containing protein [Streptomyces sp. NPDC021093]|uniref:HAAS signaling domain-containing protein n=1 Tax=Streptomyces sp. NPDC021093 TaxID=3365112 RepID=UPI0037B37BA3
MKPSPDPVHDYLSAVGREASALPADRRQELLADLAEHIEVTRAERPDAAIAEVLAELGDPRTIAATALAEAGHGAAGDPTHSGAHASTGAAGAGAPARRGKVHPLVPLLMLTLSLPFVMVFADHPGPLIGVLFRITGVVLLCTSVHWTAVQKTTGVLLAAVLPTAVIVTANLSSAGPAAGTPALLANLATLALMVGTAAWLWRVRRV